VTLFVQDFYEHLNFKLQTNASSELKVVHRGVAVHGHFIRSSSRKKSILENEKEN